MSSWIHVSEDKICGKNQRAGSMWARVHKLYEEARKENPHVIHERNRDSLKSRYQRICISVNKWIAAYREAYGRKRSGMSQQDIVIKAHTIYAADGKAFMNEYVYNEVMCKHPKWEMNLGQWTRSHAEDDEGNEESGGSSKRSRTSEDGAYSIPTKPETPGSGDSSISRPTGRDKEKKKGKGKASQSHADNSEIIEEIRALRLTKAAEVEAIKDLGKEKSNMENKKMLHRLLLALMQKDHLTPQEEEMKFHLMSKFM